METHAVIERRYENENEGVRIHTGKFEDLGGEVLEDRGGVDGGLRAYADVVLRALFEVSVDTAHGELWRACGSGP